MGNLYTSEVGDTLRDYIEHFFGCEVCRLNFLLEYDSCSLERCNRLTGEIGNIDSWKQLPLWLYEMHNAVNVRLFHEGIEQEKKDANRKGNNNTTTTKLEESFV